MNDNKAFATFVVSASIAGAIIISVTSYTESETEQKKLQLDIEKEKTKQLEI